MVATSINNTCPWIYCNTVPRYIEYPWISGQLYHIRWSIAIPRLWTLDLAIAVVGFRFYPMNSMLPVPVSPGTMHHAGTTSTGIAIDANLAIAIATGIIAIILSLPG